MNSKRNEWYLVTNTDEGVTFFITNKGIGKLTKELQDLLHDPVARTSATSNSLEKPSTLEITRSEKKHLNEQKSPAASNTKFPRTITSTTQSTKESLALEHEMEGFKEQNTDFVVSLIDEHFHKNHQMNEINEYKQELFLLRAEHQKLLKRMEALETQNTNLQNLGSIDLEYIQTVHPQEVTEIEQTEEERMLLNAVRELERRRDMKHSYESLESDREKLKKTVIALKHQNEEIRDLYHRERYRNAIHCGLGHDELQKHARALEQELESIKKDKASIKRVRTDLEQGLKNRNQSRNDRQSEYEPNTLRMEHTAIPHREHSINGGKMTNLRAGIRISNQAQTPHDGVVEVKLENLTLATNQNAQMLLDQDQELEQKYDHLRRESEKDMVRSRRESASEITRMHKSRNVDSSTKSQVNLDKLDGDSLREKHSNSIQNIIQRQRETLDLAD